MKFALGKGIIGSDEEQSGGRKHILIAAGILASALIISGGVYGFTKRSSGAQANPEFAGSVEVKRDACKLFNLEDAKKLLGSSTAASPNNANAVSPKATVSTCSYSSGDEKPEDLVALTILVRSSNKIQARQAFELAKAADAKDVDDIGTAAYYNSETDQLNVLSDEYWIIIATTKGNGEVDEDIPKSVGKTIVDRL